ncbi:AAA family ATPase [Pseudonocardia acaciae]|uniref:nSTAND1 domain-containing NTPase n=1 Tax=Pseudonocardia acaciae TaxID=551276 RepID=UPI00048A775A|nr:AAA family ATPase [Pseudonocardia acaciae]
MGDTPDADPADRCAVDAREAQGVQVGDGNTQYIYVYNGTPSDGVGPPPLAIGPGESPYRGLGAFDQADAAFFFGREAAVEELRELVAARLDDPGPLVVSGVSGAGKSSLLRAGVLPRVRRAGLAGAPDASTWPSLILTPTEAPLNELAVRIAPLAGTDAPSVLRGLGTDPASFALVACQAVHRTVHQAEAGRLLVVVDQFERLFTQCTDDAQRRGFVTALHAASARAALVVLVVRADFEARCADHPELTSAVRNRYLVTAMTERQLRLAITEPAARAGSSVDGDLVEELLARMRAGSAGAGALPLLSHALDQAWRSRAGTALTLADYERTGGVERAVGTTAQRAYDSLTAGQQAQARRVFTRLVATSPDGVDTADRVALADLVQDGSDESDEVTAVLEAFTAERLLTMAAGTVEISHEVLLTSWPLLRDSWLAESRADRIVRTRLGAVAEEWAAGSRDPAYLYRGNVLDEATATTERIRADPRQTPLGHNEREFLRASVRARLRTTRRRRALTALLAVLAVGFASVAVVAVRANQASVHQRDAAIATQLITRSQALRDTDQPMSKLLSVAAWRINPTAEARHPMLSAATLPWSGTLPGGRGPVQELAVSADGQLVAENSWSGPVQVWDAHHRRPLGPPLAGDAGEVHTLALSPDHRMLATVDHFVRLWDLDRHQQVGIPFAGAPSIAPSAVLFTPDSRTLIAQWVDGTVRLWDVATQREVGNQRGGRSDAMAVSRDGATLVSAGWDGTARLWNLATRQPIGQPLIGSRGALRSVALSQDGRAVAAGAEDGTIQVWDATTGRTIGAPWTAHRGMVLALAFSADGRTVVSSGEDGAVLVREVATGEQLGTPLAAPSGTVYSTAVSADGGVVAIGGNGEIRLWDTRPHRQIGAPVRPPSGFSGVAALAPDGRLLATGGDDGIVRLWDTATRAPAGPPLAGPGAREVLAMAFSPDGRALYAGDRGGTLRAWDVDSGTLTGTVAAVPDRPLLSLAAGPGRTVAAGGHGNGSARVWDVPGAHALDPPLGPPDAPQDRWPLNSLAWSSDGKVLATGGRSGGLRLWDAATHEQLGPTLHGSTSEITSVAFSADNRWVVTGEGDGDIRLWNAVSHEQVGEPLRGHQGEVRSVVFSPDGRTLASAGGDRTARLWDVATHQQIGPPLAGHQNVVNTVLFSRDGRVLITAAADGTVRQWSVDYLDDVPAWLCDQLGRSLTPAEWERQVPPGPDFRNVCD